MGKGRFLGPKWVKHMLFGPENIISQIGQKWLKNGQKMFSMPKKDKKVAFGPYFFFGEIGQKMGEKWLKVDFQA